jgi:MerR family transcriptional regulator, redox-sensitive transcriptional activator SoxR
MDQPPPEQQEFTVGQLAVRSGVSISALHFYERQNLICSRRTFGNQRRYRRETLRRVALIRIAQRVGIPLARIKAVLDLLPEGRTPTREDWTRMSEGWRADLDERIHQLQQLRDDFNECVGCGCLSINRCDLVNPLDRLAERGPGPQRLLGPRRRGPGEAARTTVQLPEPRDACAPEECADPSGEGCAVPAGAVGCAVPEAAVGCAPSEGCAVPAGREASGAAGCAVPEGREASGVADGSAGSCDPCDAVAR